MNKIIDEKANDIIKYRGGGTGLFTLGIPSTITKNDAIFFFWAIPAYCLAVVSLWFAVLARKPTPGFFPPSASEAFEYASSYKKDAKARFIGEWHIANVAMRQVLSDESRRVEWASWTFLATIASLIIPVLVAILRTR